MFIAILIGKKEIKGLGDCVGTIIKNHGYKGFFKGLGALVLRDSSSYGLYFVSFEYLRRALKSNGMENKLLVDFICGGLAGKFIF
jgi:solute carrier family 25 carnitine/acylcarnitine transporter 20/29